MMYDFRSGYLEKMNILPSGEKVQAWVFFPSIDTVTLPKITGVFPGFDSFRKLHAKGVCAVHSVLFSHISTGQVSVA